MQDAGPIEVDEALPAEPLNANWNAPWTCAGIGGGGGAICKHPFTVIPVNTSRILFLNVKFSEDVVKEKNCVLPNVAKIKVAPGGTPRGRSGLLQFARAGTALSARFRPLS